MVAIGVVEAAKPVPPSASSEAARVGRDRVRASAFNARIVGFTRKVEEACNSAVYCHYCKRFDGLRSASKIRSLYKTRVFQILNSLCLSPIAT